MDDIADKPSSQEFPVDKAGIAPGTPAAAAVLADDEYSRFLLNHPNAISQVLRGLIDHVSQVTMFFNAGRDMVITSLVSFDDKRLVLDYGPSMELNRKALEADRLFCVTQLDKVKIQFLLGGLTRIETDRGPAFQAALPESVLRLQRREFYRLTTPIARPLICAIPVNEVDGSKRFVESHIADISGGGVGVISLPKDMLIEESMEFPNCRLDLPEIGRITATLKIRSVMEIETRTGGHLRRAGCEFINLPGPMLTMIQRYILKIERERKARESGLG
jgi:flagellar brake protein